MIGATDLRLPGVYFVPPARPAAPELPPLDVAAFVGFAERGPLHTPVALEDADAYRDVFGGAVPLARGAGDVAVLGHLPATIDAFFANGGRRCHVVRVAAPTAERGRFVVPGIVAVGLREPRLAAVPAAWEGTWAGQLSLSTRLDLTALPPAAFHVATANALVWLTGTAPQAIGVGDVLRLTFDEGVWLFPVSRAAQRPDPAAATGADAATAARAVDLVAARTWRLTPVDPASPPMPVFELARVGDDAEEPLGLDAFLGRRGDELALELGPLAPDVDPRWRFERGQVLALRLADGSRHLFPVRRVSAEASGGSPPLRATTLFADAMLALAPSPLPVTSPPALERVERLRFDLAVWDGRAQQPTLAALAFNRGHRRFWGETVFLESSPRYRRPAAHAESDVARDAAGTYRRLVTGVRLDEGPDGALGLAGMAARLAPLDDARASRTYLPVGMPGVFDEDARVGPIAPGADGLERFDAHLFVDPVLVPDPAIQPPTGAALLAEAFHRHYVENRRLQGMHAVLYVSEVALLAVPDATHAAWSRAAAAPRRPFVAPAPPAPPPPDLSRFADCDQPAPPMPEPPPLPPVPTDRRLPDELAFELATLLEIHEAMLGLSTARGDVVSLFSLPSGFDKRAGIGWHEGLRLRLGLPARRTVGADVSDRADLSYAAVYHPWLLVRETTARDGLRAIPPDGAIAGTIAARERARGAWIAPANVPLASVLGLEPKIATDDLVELFERQFNLPDRQPRDVRAMSAHTLADDRRLLQLSVRRLMILLRKVAAELGMDLVFAPNDERLRDRVELTLTRMLTDMLARGALAGATAEEAFRVVTGDAVMTARDRDAGRFLAVIQVAPSQPLEFLTVLLTRVGDGLVRATEA